MDAGLWTGTGRGGERRGHVTQGGGQEALAQQLLASGVLLVSFSRDNLKELPPPPLPGQLPLLLAACRC